jgi:hypothetical protein
MNTTAYILALIKTKGFVEAKNINILAKDLGTNRTAINHIIGMIGLANDDNLPKTKFNYEDYFFKNKYSTKGKVVIAYKWADESKNVLSDKMNEILGVK